MWWQARSYDLPLGSKRENAKFISEERAQHLLSLVEPNSYPQIYKDSFTCVRAPARLNRHDSEQEVEPSCEIIISSCLGHSHPVHRGIDSDCMAVYWSSHRLPCQWHRCQLYEHLLLEPCNSHHPQQVRFQNGKWLSTAPLLHHHVSFLSVFWSLGQFCSQLCSSSNPKLFLQTGGRARGGLCSSRNRLWKRPETRNRAKVPRVLSVDVPRSLVSGHTLLHPPSTVEDLRRRKDQEVGSRFAEIHCVSALSLLAVKLMFFYHAKVLWNPGLLKRTEMHRSAG